MWAQYTQEDHLETIKEHIGHVARQTFLDMHPSPWVHVQVYYHHHQFRFPSSFRLHVVFDRVPGWVLPVDLVARRIELRVVAHLRTAFSLEYPVQVNLIDREDIANQDYQYEPW